MPQFAVAGLTPFYFTPHFFSFALLPLTIVSSASLPSLAASNRTQRSKGDFMKPIKTLALIFALALAPAAAAQKVEKKGMTLEAAKKVIAAAVADARSKSAPGGAIAVATRAAIS
jgi:hypothetical protein